MTVPTIWLVLIFAVELVIAWCWGFMWAWRHWVEPAVIRWITKRENERAGLTGGKVNDDDS